MPSTTSKDALSGYVNFPAIKGIDGIRFDFSDGARVFLHPDAKEPVLCRFYDEDELQLTGQVQIQPGQTVTTTKKYFVRHKIEVYSTSTKQLLFSHEFDASGKDVLMKIAKGTIGDAIAWFPAAIAFQKKHKCKLSVCMDKRIAELLKGQYPDVTFLSDEDLQEKEFYATYIIGIFPLDEKCNHQPFDFRKTGLHGQASNILQVPMPKEPPKLNLTAKREIKEKYVCIAAQATAYCKTWNNPFGWVQVIDFLKANGYRVLCVDKERVYGEKNLFTYMPIGAEDFTGEKPLQERVNLIKNADFFIGLPSGLSWIAWACKVPVVLISGFSLPYSEFETPYRVINYNACHGCWEDANLNMIMGFKYGDCPRLKGTEREFECNRLISAQRVINTIKQIPKFRKGS